MAGSMLAFPQESAISRPQKPVEMGEAGGKFRCQVGLASVIEHTSQTSYSLPKQSSLHQYPHANFSCLVIVSQIKFTFGDI